MGDAAANTALEYSSANVFGGQAADLKGAGLRYLIVVAVTRI